MHPHCHPAVPCVLEMVGNTERRRLGHSREWSPDAGVRQAPSREQGRGGLGGPTRVTRPSLPPARDGLDSQLLFQ